MRLPIILDTDPGIDDAAAIAAALFAPELDLQLMTVAGNVSVEKTTVTRCNCCTSGMPMCRWRRALRCRWCVLRDAASVHGESGMEGYDFVEHRVNRWRSRPSGRSAMRLCTLPSRSLSWRLAR